MAGQPVSLFAFRKKYPGYDDLSDFQVTNALHKKFQSETNSDISLDDFAKELDVGIETQELALPQAGIDTGIGRQEDPQQIIADTQALPATPETRLSALTGELGELKRPDGGISTELSTTVTDQRLNNGLPTNIPILIKGQEGVDQLLSGKAPTNRQQEIAINRAIERVGEGQDLPSYQSIDEAVTAAQARSNEKSVALPVEQPPFTGLDVPQDAEQLISDVEKKTGKSVRDSFWQSISKTIKNLPEDFQAGFAGAQMSGLEGELVQELERQKGFKFKSKIGQEFQAQQIKSLENRIKQAKIDREKAISEKEPVDVEPQSLKYYGSAAVRSLGLMAPALLAGILTRNPANTLTIMAPQAKGEAFGRARIEKELSREEAENYANATAAAEVIPELLPVSTLLKPGYKMFERVLKSTAAEVAQELVTESLQIGIDKGTIEPDMEWGEARQRLIDAGILAGIAGPTQSAIAHPLVKGVEKVAEKAEQRQVLKDIDEAEFAVPAEEVAVERLKPGTTILPKKTAGLKTEPKSGIQDISTKELNVRMSDLKIAEENLKKGKESVTPDDPVEVEYNVDTKEYELIDGYHRYLKLRGGDIETALSRAKNDDFPDIKAEVKLVRNVDKGGFPGTEPVALDEAAKQEIDTAAKEAATSPENDLPEPTQAQKEAGTYKKGHVSIGGLDIAIENPKGSERTGTDSDGETWSVTMNQHYGYIKRTEGADGDHVDVFLGDNASDTNLPVFVVNQVDPKTKAFDEHKVMMGFSNVTDARKAYQGNYAKGWKGNGGITKFSAGEFKDWVKNGDTTKPAGEIKTEKPPKILASQMAETGKVFSPKETDQRNELSAEANTYSSPGETHQPLYQSSDTAGFERPESGIVEAGKKKIAIPTPNKAMRRESIRVALVNIIGPRLYEGKIRGKKRLGFFRRESGEVRVKRYGDVEVMAHEMAHFLDFHSKIKAPFQTAYKSKEFKKEIEGLSYTDEESVVKSEGFAEFVRLWLTRYPEAKANAPAFTEKFEAILSKDKKLNKQMDKLQNKMHQWYYQGSDARLSAVMDGNKLTNKEKLDTVLHKKPTELMKQKTIDHIHGAKVIERQVHGKLLDATESGYKQLQLINGIEGIFAESTKKGAPFIAKDGSINFKGPALDSIFRKSIIAGSEVFEKHQKYFIARRAEELKGQDRENLLDQGMIDAGLRHATRYPYFKKSFEDYQEYRKNLMDFMVDTGYVEQQAAENMLRVNQNYVPFNRVVEGIGESFAGGSNFKRLKGGSQNIQNVYDNIVMGDFQHIKGSLQAKALRNMYESGLKSENGSKFFSVIGSDSQLVKTQVDQMASKVASAMKEFDVTITKDGQVVSGDLSGTVVDLEQINKYFQKNPEELMFWTFGNQPKTTETKVTSFISSKTGKRVWVEIQREAELIVDMLDNLNGWSLPPGLFGKAVGYAYAVKNIQTVLITSMPQFSIPNLVRDIQTATIISGGKFKPVYHNMLGFASILKNAMGKNSMYTEMIANGGGWAGRARSALDETAGRTHHEMPGHWLKPQLFLSNVLNTYIQIIDSPEMSTRVGYYIQQRKEGKSARESAFQAREISTDFRKHGSYAPFVMLQRTIPFHGAFVQSVDRDIRAFAEKDGETKFTNLYKTESGRATLEDIKVRMAIVAAGFAATALLLATMNSDEDWYQDLTEDERVRFFHIKVGGERYQIPKPHGFFSMIMQGVETFIDYLNQKEGADASKVMLYSLAYNLNSDFFPGIANPWIELAMNKNFADSSIVPPFLERASPELQFTERTPQLYVELGDSLGISPLQANHIMKGYLGYLENFISDTAEMSLWNKEAWGERPFQSGAKQYFGKQFLPKNVPYRTRWIEKYYEARGKAVTAKIDLSLAEKRLPFDKKMKNVIKSKTTNYLASLDSIFKKADKEASELREISMYVMYDKKMSVEQKEKKINDIRFKKNRNFKIYYNAIDATIKKLEKQIKAVNGG